MLVIPSSSKAITEAFQTTLTNGDGSLYGNGNAQNANIPFSSKVPRPPGSSSGPGPGHYNSGYYGSIAHRVRTQFHAKSIAGRHFIPEFLTGHAGPGPGAYEGRKQPVNCPTFTIKGKPSTVHEITEKMFPMPGPAEYSPRPTASVRVATIKGRKFAEGATFAITDLSIPGPGTYDPRPPQKNPGSVRPPIGLPIPSPPSKVPGPGHYNPKRPQEKPRAARLISRIPPPELASEAILPGPGAYHLRSACFDDGVLSTGAFVPGASFGRRPLPLKEHPRASSPGPGAYECKSLFDSISSRAPTISTKPKEPDVHLDEPGPGHYEIDGMGSRPSKPGTSVPSLKFRHPAPPLSDAPGPGTYDIVRFGGATHSGLLLSSTNHRSGAGMGMGGTSSSGGVGMGGDGDGSNRSTVSSPRIQSIRAHRRAAGQHKSPGPASYSPKTSLADLLDRSLGISFKGRVPIFEDHHDAGPGSYEVQSPLGTGAPKFSIKFRQPIPSVDRHAVPGPGTYDLPSIFDKASSSPPPRPNHGSPASAEELSASQSGSPTKRLFF